MTAQLGLSNVCLSSGNLAKASREADSFLESALSTADPHIQALAWEMKTLIAMGEDAWEAAAHHLREALSIVEKFEVPVAAWQVHSTAWDFYRYAKNEAAAARNRSLAETYVLGIGAEGVNCKTCALSVICEVPLTRTPFCETYRALVTEL